ncbi:hypothetical protein [Myceligenerans pegani]|uniref:Uncharacterized protein n=1 Tax=Myceligenerans pegani TaxID=2776917 RepID=A0ABR9MXM7_9MICO|nr:hypothetical protein [Myceligenerans sp. TRM 65318]MBE1875875.1 hypothetical protein [Myceligenerans sp. TRM 65318]MBE3018146.1 hypothetical protein [Myceligenerans sp. TRM 65318]
MLMLQTSDGLDPEKIDDLTRIAELVFGVFLLRYGLIAIGILLLVLIATALLRRSRRDRQVPPEWQERGHDLIDRGLGGSRAGSSLAHGVWSAVSGDRPQDGTGRRDDPPRG